MNVTEYLEYLFSLGMKEDDFPALQPLFQFRIWERFKPGGGPDKLERAIEELRKEDHRFNMDGGSWTNNLSWVRGYDDVLGPMERLVHSFSKKSLSQVAHR